MLAAMPFLLRPAIAWLLVLVMPFHVLTAAYLDLRGPAHVHATQGAPVHEHARDHEYNHVIRVIRLHGYAPDSGHSHTHRHDGIERHHHDPADSTVVTV